MPQVAGLQDFRQEGPPADIGTFQLPCSVLVFQHVFAGTTYVCAVRAGERGWVLVSHLPINVANSTIVIQAAINSLTAGRTWKETVCIIGSYTIQQITDTSYTILDISQATLALADSVNDWMIVCDGINDFEIIGGILYGNYTHQNADGVIRLGVSVACYNFLIYGTRIYDGYAYCISIAGSYDGVVEAVTLSTAGDDNIEIRDASHDIDVVAINSYSPRNDLPPAASSCLEIEDGCYNISVLGGKFVDSPAVGITISCETPGDIACMDISIVGAIIQDAGTYSVDIIGGAGQLCQRINLVNLTVINDSGGGVWIRDYTTQITIMGGTFYVSSARALRFTNTTWITVQGAITYDDFGSYNIEVNGCSYVDLSVKIMRAYNHGIYMTDSTEIEVHDSIIREVSKHTNNTYAGIQINNSTYVKVHDNIIDGGAAGNRMDYGIEETGTSNYNTLKDNKFLNAQTLPVLRIGANTTVPSVIVPCIRGTTSADDGYTVDAPAEIAVAWLFIPKEAQQVLGLKVVALANVAEADKMRAEFTIYGAADNEPYNTHNGSIADHPSTTSNFANGDVIYWKVTTAGVLALNGGDSVMVILIYESAGDGDCATNTYVRTVEIEYV